MAGGHRDRLDQATTGSCRLKCKATAHMVACAMARALLSFDLELFLATAGV